MPTSIAATAEQEERRLVARLRAGDEAAFAAFAAGYLPGLLRFALRRVGTDRELARDLVQTTVCRVLEKLDGYRAEAPLFTWLCACCRNEIAGHFRRVGRRPREVELDASESAFEPAAGAMRAPEEGPEDQLLRLERAELVHAALDRLPPVWAQVVEWRYVEGLAVGEIASRLESSYKAAESQLSRARAAFREVYRQLARGADAAWAVGESSPAGEEP